MFIRDIGKKKLYTQMSHPSLQVDECVCGTPGGLCTCPHCRQGSSVNQYKALLTDNSYPIMKYFYPDGSELFQDDPALIHRPR